MNVSKMTIPAAFLIAAAFAGAAEGQGAPFPEVVSFGGKECRLNGVGVRSKLFFEVYLGALYLATPTKEAAAAIAADEPKRVVMHFVYAKVGAEKIREVWGEGFRNNSAAALPQLQERLARFSSWFDEDLVKGDRIELTYLPGQGTEVVVKGKTRGTIEGADFMRALWAVWLGGKPADAGLKKGMLGAD